MKKSVNRYLRMLFEICYSALPCAGLLLVLDGFFGLSWSHGAAVLLAVLFQALLYWSEEKGFRIQAWCAVLVLNSLAGLFFFWNGHLPEAALLFWEMEGASAAAGVFCYLSRRRLWMKVPVFLLLSASLIYFCLEEISMAKWEVCMILFYALLFLSEVAEQKTVLSGQNRRNTLYLFPVFLLSVLLLFFLPVRTTPMGWEFFWNMANTVKEKVVAVVTDLEYFFSDKDSAYSISFTGYGGDGTLGRGIFSVDSPQISVEGIGTRAPLYLAGSIYSEYTGQGWEPQTQEKPYEEAEYRLAYKEMQKAFSESVYTTEELRELRNQRSFRISYDGLKTESLFIAPFTERIVLPSGISVSGGQRDDLALSKPGGVGFSYDISFMELNYEDERMKNLLRGQAFETRPSVEGEEKIRQEFIHKSYTQLPDTLPDRVRELAEKITAGADNDYDRLKAMESYLKGYSYTTTPEEAPQGQDFTDFFLFESKSGYCTYFATALAVLARCEGIPTRFVEGFETAQTCEQKDSQIALTGTDAHAWAEAYMDGIGWIPFEATSGYQNSGGNNWGTSAQTEIPKMDSPIVPNESEEALPAESTLPESEKSWEGIQAAFLLLGRVVLGLLVFCGVVCGIVLLRKSRKRRGYREKDREDKIRCLMARVLSFGTRYAMPIAEGETLLAYEVRIRGGLDAKEMSFGQMCELYQSIRFGGKNAGEQDVRTLENYVKELECQYLQECSILRKIWYWCAG